MVNNQEVNSDIPRFVVTIVDTQTKLKVPEGEKYLSISAAADEIEHFLKPYTKKQTASHKGAKNEIESMFGFFTDEVGLIPEAEVVK